MTATYTWTISQCDQLDSLFKAGVFPAEMAEQIQAVKDAIPKP